MPHWNGLRKGCYLLNRCRSSESQRRLSRELAHPPDMTRFLEMSSALDVAVQQHRHRLRREPHQREQLHVRSRRLMRSTVRNEGPSPPATQASIASC
ncbi:hypothetical protein K7X08_018636 [Anisodus acutangulus]|uniref:Uncharacterized protein n=1 Tax=Anisodus acutangulus TaxID=402998 RepID=A0A9Q1LW26_9SOLA|nr:hypothetical protein K7X08_018636 [Anisodus acutangulus]